MKVNILELNIKSCLYPCYRSLFGGQVLSIEGSGFGSDMSRVSVSLGGRSCDLSSLSSSQILCTTAPTTQTHLINNNAWVEQYWFSI